MRGQRQPLLMFRPELGIDDLKGRLSALESLLYERKSRRYSFVRVMKEGTDVMLCAMH